MSFFQFVFDKFFLPEYIFASVQEPVYSRIEAYIGNKKAHALRIGSKMKGVNATKKLQNYEQI